MVADYTIDQRLLNARIVVELIRRERSLNFLPHVGVHPSLRDDTPSWAPSTLDDCLKVKVTGFPTSRTGGIRLIGGRLLGLKAAFFGHVTAVYPSWTFLQCGNMSLPNSAHRKFFSFIDLVSHLDQTWSSSKIQGWREGLEFAGRPGLAPGFCLGKSDWTYYYVEDRAMVRKLPASVEFTTPREARVKCGIHGQSGRFVNPDIGHCLHQPWSDAWICMAAESSIPDAEPCNAVSRSSTPTNVTKRAPEALLEVPGPSTYLEDQHGRGERGESPSAPLLEPKPAYDDQREILFLTDLGIMGTAPRVRPGDAIYDVGWSQFTMVARPEGLLQVAEDPWTVETHTFVSRVMRFALKKRGAFDYSVGDLYLV